MINNYLTYITERNISFSDNLTKILVDICNELNIEINKNNYFRVIYDDSIIVAINRESLFLSIKNDFIKIDTLHSPKWLIIEKEDFNNLKNVLKNSILIAHTIFLLENKQKNFGYICDISLCDTFDEIVKKLIHINEIDILLFYFKNNYYPKYITDKYQYLIQANNFDLL